MGGCRRTLIPGGAAPAEEHCLLGRVEAARRLLGMRRLLPAWGPPLVVGESWEMISSAGLTRDKITKFRGAAPSQWAEDTPLYGCVKPSTAEQQGEACEEGAVATLAWVEGTFSRMGFPLCLLIPSNWVLWAGGKLWYLHALSRQGFVVGSVGAENRGSMGVRLNVTVWVGCWASTSLMCVYLLFSFVPWVFLWAWVFFKAHPKPCPGTALALGKQKIREPPVWRDKYS